MLFTNQIRQIFSFYDWTMQLACCSFHHPELFV